MITSMYHSVCSIIEILHAPTAVTITVFSVLRLFLYSQVSDHLSVLGGLPSFGANSSITAAAAPNRGRQTFSRTGNPFFLAYLQPN